MNEYGEDFWYARDLQNVLQYAEWCNFIKVIEKAKVACETSENEVLDHFGSGSAREVEDIMLSRYASYLIVQNADSKKEIVALGKDIFIKNKSLGRK